MSLQIASFVCLIAFSLLGAFDGLYFHMIKYRLHKHPPAKLEHRIHTVRGFVFSAIGLLLFAFDSSGPLLLIACALILVDVILEIIDIVVEKEARRELGGIDPAESVLHVFASSFKFAAMLLILLDKPGTSFSSSAPLLGTKEMALALQIFAYGFSSSILVISVASVLLDLRNSKKARPPQIQKNPAEAEAIRRLAI